MAEIPQAITKDFKKGLLFSLNQLTTLLKTHTHTHTHTHTFMCICLEE